MDTIFKLLTKDMDRDIKQQIGRRRDAMMRNIQYMNDIGHDDYKILIQHNWNVNRFNILCVLNSFYQIVLGPLTSSVRDRNGILGDEVPILHGTIKFDREHNAALRKTHLEFMAIILDAGISGKVLTAPHASDMLYRLRQDMIPNG